MYNIYINKGRRQAERFLPLSKSANACLVSFAFGNSRLTSWRKLSLVISPPSPFLFSPSPTSNDHYCTSNLFRSPRVKVAAQTLLAYSLKPLNLPLNPFLHSDWMSFFPPSPPSPLPNPAAAEFSTPGPRGKAQSILGGSLGKSPLPASAARSSRHHASYAKPKRERIPNACPRAIGRKKKQPKKKRPRPIRKDPVEKG